MTEDLSDLKKVWTEVTAGKKETFRVPEDHREEEWRPWPADYATQLGIQPGHPMVEDPAASITKSAYLVRYEAARHIAVMSKAREVLDLKTPNQAREVVARCPELAHGIEPFLTDWRWVERTSCAHATNQDAEDQQRQVKKTPAIITNLIWKLKIQARSDTLTGGSPEPLLNIQTLREALVDIAFIPSWAAGGNPSYYKKNIDLESAKRFAMDCQDKNPPYDPYTAAATCAACDVPVVPGALSDHVKKCEEITPKGYRLNCRCRKQFKTLASLTQHRILHCRATEPCKVCNEDNQHALCRCRQIRKAICEEIWNEIHAATEGSGTIYDLSNKTAIMATKDELIHLLRRVADRLPPRDNEVPMWELMDKSRATPEPWSGAHNLSKAETPHSPGASEEDTTIEDEAAWNDLELKTKPDTWDCDECGAFFTNPAELQDHQETDHPIPLECLLCNEEFHTQGELDTHEKTHVRCEICDQLFYGSESLSEHRKNIHKQYTCRICWAAMPTEAELATHQSTVCGQKCQVCDKSGLTPTTLDLHMAHSHPWCNDCALRFATRTAYQQHLPCPLRQKIKAKIQQEYKMQPPRCGFCGVEFTSSKEFNNHLPCPPGTRCKICGVQFTSVKEFDNHLPCPPKRKQVNFEREQFNCEKCNARFHDAPSLLNHDMQNHQNTDKSPLICVECEAPVEDGAYMTHIRNHVHLYKWNLKGQTCPKCPGTKLGSVAEALEHVRDRHKEHFTNFLMSVEEGKKQNNSLPKERALIQAIRQTMGAEDELKCPYEGCHQTFYTAEDLQQHKETHGCKTCGFVPTDSKDLQEHERLHSRAKTEGTFTCTKCGQRLSSFEELTAHEGTHSKYACGRCKQKFASAVESNRHEENCGSIAGIDVFGAAGSSDPTLVLAKCLQTVVSATEKDLEPGTAELMRDQIRKAISAQTGKTTLRKNHLQQRTFTFIKPPVWQPSNTTNQYNDKDIAPLRNCTFSGTGTAEENYTKLQELVQAISRIVRARSLTKDIATDLLLQHLKSPAKDLANSFKEEFELRFGSSACPEFQDVLLYLETTFIAIKPAHAKEQLLSLKRHNGETLTAFYIRAWRCSHFASFTTSEAERPRFRETTVKETITRNLAPKQRELVDQEELERGLRYEAAMGPREIIDFLNHLKSNKEALDSDKARPDFTIVGQMATGVRQLGRDRQRNRQDKPEKQRKSPKQREERQPAFRYKRKQDPESHPRDQATPKTAGRVKTNNGKKIRTLTAETPQKKDRPPTDTGNKEWIEAATKMAGPGACWKCTRKGHGHRECRTYTLLTRRPCPTCQKGYHHPKACRKDKPAWRTGPTEGTPRGRGSRSGRANYHNPRPARFTWTKDQHPRKGAPPPTTGANRTTPTSRGRGRGAKNHGQTKQKPGFLHLDRVRQEPDLVEEFMQGLRGDR